MCAPLIAGLVLSAASVAANSIGASQVADARKDDQEAERIRQQGFDKEAAATNLQSRGRYQDFSGKQADRATELGDILGKNATPATPSATLMPQSGSNVVTTENAKQGAAATAYGQQQSGALGTLRAFGDLLGEDSRLQGRDAQTIAQIGDFKRGSAGVLQGELAADNSAGQGAQMFGDILGGIGGLASKGVGGGIGDSLGGMFGGGGGGVVSSAPSFAYTNTQPGAIINGGTFRSGSLY